MQQENVKRIAGLDGVRGFGAMWIIAFHVAVLGGYTEANAWLNRTIGRGDCFVRMFFLLSGFSLMYTYFEKFINREFDIELFIRKRIVKLYPLFLICLAAHCFINVWQGNKNSLPEIIGSASMLFALLPSHQDSIVWAGWSMGIQMAFYLVFPVFLVFCKNKKRTWATFAVAAILLWIYVAYYCIDVPSPHINILRQFIYFVAGALIYHYKGFLEGMRPHLKAVAGVMCLLAEVASFFLFVRVQEDVVMLVAFSALVILQILGIDFLMNCSILAFLGRISYEIYLLHPLVYRLWYMLQIPVPAGGGYLTAFLIHFAGISCITIAIAYCLKTVSSYAHSKR